MNRHSRGLTLIELLITLTIAAVLMIFSVSFWPAFYHKNQLKVVVDEITMAINSARIEALITGQTLILAPLLGVGDWSKGMVLMVDKKAHQTELPAKVIHEWRWLQQGLQIKWHGFQSSNYLRFNSAIRHNTTNGYFMINNKLEQKKLVVNRLGRVRSSTDGEN